MIISAYKGVKLADWLTSQPDNAIAPQFFLHDNKYPFFEFSSIGLRESFDWDFVEVDDAAAAGVHREYGAVMHAAIIIEE